MCKQSFSFVYHLMPACEIIFRHVIIFSLKLLFIIFFSPLNVNLIEKLCTETGTWNQYGTILIVQSF